MAITSRHRHTLGRAGNIEIAQGALVQGFAASTAKQIYGEFRGNLTTIIISREATQPTSPDAFLHAVLRRNVYPFIVSATRMEPSYRLSLIPRADVITARDEYLSHVHDHNNSIVEEWQRAAHDDTDRFADHYPELALAEQLEQRAESATGHNDGQVGRLCGDFITYASFALRTVLEAARAQQRAG
jgi:hypothetical protein